MFGIGWLAAMIVQRKPKCRQRENSTDEHVAKSVGMADSCVNEIRKTIMLLYFENCTLLIVHQKYAIDK